MARVLASGMLSAGPEVEAFEEEFAAKFGFRHAIAVSSGSAALHLAMLALGIEPGSRVALPSYVCVALLNAIRLVGAAEVLLDSQPGGFNADLGSLPDDLDALILPHMFGEPANPGPAIVAGITVIEDCALAPGATTEFGKPLGHMGKLAVYSLYSTKPLAAGEGGVITTQDDRIAGFIRDRREYDKRANYELRFNYKLTDLQAAIARCQLGRLEPSTTVRRDIARRYRDALGDADLDLFQQPEGGSCQRFLVAVRCGVAAAEEHFARAGIAIARPVFRPLHRLLGVPASAFPQAEDRFLTVISLPIYPTLSASEQERVIAAARAIPPPIRSS